MKSPLAIGLQAGFSMSVNYFFALVAKDAPLDFDTAAEVVPHPVGKTPAVSLRGQGGGLLELRVDLETDEVIFWLIFGTHRWPLSV